MLYLLLAAFNEEKDLGALLSTIEQLHWQWPYRIFIVNDGSTDNTAGVAAQFARKLPLTLISHPVNMGLGKALSTGFTAVISELKSSDDDIVVTMDADNTHPPELIEQMRETILAGSDIVIASRFTPGASVRGVTVLRKLLSQGVRAIMKTLCPISGVNDYSSGYRAYSGKTLSAAAKRFGAGLVSESGFAATVELLAKTSIFALKISEAPLDLRYDRKSSASKINIPVTIARYMALILKLRSILKSKG